MSAKRGGILGQAGPLLLGRGGATVLSFALPLLLVRLLPQDQFGTYKQVWLVISTGYSMLQLGLSQSLYYFVPRKDGRQRAWLTQAMLFVGVLGALGGAALYLLRFAIAGQFHNPGLAQFGLPLALIAFCLTASTPLEIELTALGKIRQAALCIFCSDAVRVLASVVPLLLGWGLSGFFWAYVLHGALRLIACQVVLYQQGGPELDSKLMLQQLAYALPFGAAILLDQPQKTFHQWAVGWSVDAATFAIYAQGCFQLPIVNLIYSPISDVLQVRLAEPGGRDHALAHFHEANLRLAAVLLPFTALMCSAAALFVPALFTHRYDASIPIFRIAILATPFACLPLDGTLRALGKTSYLFRIFFWKLIVTVPLVLLGLKLFGMPGAIAGHVVSEAAIRLTMLQRVHRELGVGFREALPWAQLAQLSAASLVACAPVLAVSHLAAAGPRPFVALCAAGALYGAVYLGALALGPGQGGVVVKLRRTLFGDEPAPAA